ncbi:hypothetical protein ABT300_36515 [Streptomyces sp. NPDC001027]|uniref:hypothetical protein n=1 Tax=Streptomyces sp. NPDC001027 TaxID=3154771 RepID=UPI00332B9554
MASKTDNDLALVLYRFCKKLQVRLAGDEKDLDRRFDEIMAEIDRQKRQMVRSGLGRSTGIACARTVVGSVRTAVLARTAASGAVGALAAQLTQGTQGWISAALAALTGAATAAAVVVLIDIRKPNDRSGRSRRRAEETVSTPHP